MSIVPGDGDEDEIRDQFDNQVSYEESVGNRRSKRGI